MRLLTILIIFLASIASFAQAPIEATTADGKKVLLHPDGTWKWKSEDENKPAENTTADLRREKAIKDVTPEKVSLFFDDYNDKYMKFTVWLGELKEVPNEKGEVYAALIKTQDNKIFSNYIFPNNLGFIMHSSLARLTTAEIEASAFGSSRMYGVNIYVLLKKSPLGHKLGVINCIEFLTRNNKAPYDNLVRKAIGECK